MSENQFLERPLLNSPLWLLPGRQRPVQGVEDDPQAQYRRRCLGHSEQRHLQSFRQAEVGSHCRQGDQSPGRWSHEGLQGEL